MDIIDNIIYIIKIFYKCVCVIYIFKRLGDFNKKNVKDIILIIISSTIITLICFFIKKILLESIFANLFLYFSITLVINILFEQDNRSILLNTIIGFAIYYVFFAFCVGITFVIEIFLKFQNKLLMCFIMIILHFIIVKLFFYKKRFKNGLKFLKKEYQNDFIDIMLLNICSIIMLLYSLVTYNSTISGNDTLEYTSRNFIKYIYVFVLIFGIIMIVIIRKTLTLSYKQKLLQNTLNDYESQLKEKDKMIENLSNEKFKISKLNHEFYNRQKALELKVENALNNMKFEVGEEFDLREKIKALSEEYSDKAKENKNNVKLSKTDIEEIDDMFEYMKTECVKNDIEFILQINGNIHYLINNIIPKNKLVTLIGDHLRDAIIAVNCSDNKYKSILAILEIKDNCYEFCIYDSGIEFEIGTFDKLGLEPATTHKDTGGTGIGFMTTFETLKETKGSLIIEEKNEMLENNYTKAVKFRFDGKNEFKIVSYRASKIKAGVLTSNIIIKNLK